MNNNKLTEKQLIFIFKKKTDDKINELEERIKKLELFINNAFQEVELDKQSHNKEINTGQEIEE